MSRRPVVADDPVFLRAVLGTCDRVLACLNDERKAASTVPELLAVADATDWIEGQAANVRRRLARAERDSQDLARAAQVAQVSL